MPRRLAAIFVADIVGYSRLMGRDEAGTLQRFAELRAKLIDPAIDRHSGRVFKSMGDALCHGSKGWGERRPSGKCGSILGR